MLSLFPGWNCRIVPGASHKRRAAMKSPSARDMSEISDAVAGHHTPLVDAVLERAAATDQAPFHIPGHKRGTAVHPTFRKLMGTGLAHDLTEILGEHAGS